MKTCHQNLLTAAVDYFSEVFNLMKLLLLVPATNAVGEHLASALRSLKTTMLQERLNTV